MLMGKEVVKMPRVIDVADERLKALSIFFSLKRSKRSKESRLENFNGHASGVILKKLCGH